MVSARRSATKLVREEALASMAARTDTLTQLPNRMALNEEMKRRDQNSLADISVPYLDINGLKIVNESVSHSGGDKLIGIVKDRLQSLREQPGFLARVGGDEFVMLVEGSGAACKARAIAAEVRQVMSPEFRIANRGFQFSLAIGHEERTNLQSCDEAMRRADLAVYCAKRQGSSELFEYTPLIESESARRREVEEALISALARPDEFQVHYQPIVHATSGQTVKVEALARWTSAQLGEVPPDVFISVAEETGLIARLGKVIFHRICDDLIARPDLVVCINISPAQLTDGEFVRNLIATLDNIEVDPSRVEIELTEGLVVSNADLAAYKLAQLHEAGFRTSLDDFGTGFSSIGYLKQLPFNALKIDKSFLRDLPGDKNELGMVRAIILMGHSLNQTVVCEGVEKAEQVELLRHYNCDLLQGFWFSRAVPLEVLPILNQAGKVTMLAGR